jgi:AcrR family transcriptional regulator
VHVDAGLLRKDALRNRERLLGAAREVFLAEGIGVPMRQIAEQAGVGVGTLYRRFPTRQSLVDACFADKIAEYLAEVERAAASDDAWAGFTGFVQRICQMQAEDDGFKDVLMTVFPTEQRVRAYRGLHSLVVRAQEQGALRADFGVRDLAFVFWANAAFLAATKDAAPGTWQRYVALMIDACRAQGASPLPAPPLSAAQLTQAIDGARDRLA